MLSELRVESLGIIDELTIVLGTGMTAITGETGAGKTLLVEAIELLVGGRADPALVRDGATEARVEGRFVDPRTDDDIVLTRVIPTDGRSRAYVNGRLATVAELADHGQHLVDLHGQHAHQSLLAPAVQRGALDRFAGVAALEPLAAYREARKEVRRVDEELFALGGDDRARAREIDLLRFQVEEIDDAAVGDPVEVVALEAQEALLADATAHREALSSAYHSIEAAALDAVGSAAAALAGRAPFAELEARVRAAQTDLSEIEHDLRTTAESVVVDPERLAAVQLRRKLLRDLIRKYGETLDDVKEYAAVAHQRLADLEQYEARAAHLEAARAEAQQRADGAGRKLSRARRAAAPRLAAAVTDHVRELAMPAATFEVQIEGGAPTDDGIDAVAYQLSANAGEPPRALAKAASGGELSRTMLAARLVLTEAPPTLIFDEVDAGVGGEAGAAIGRELQTLGAKHQVLCVTHLPQVAAYADAQIEVLKQTVTGRTVATADLVLDDARVSALSRMLAGVDSSAHARAHAEELLVTATRSRGARRRKASR